MFKIKNMSQKKLYFFANWKMYLDYDESNILANGLVEVLKNKKRDYEMTIFPNALSLQSTSQTFNDIGINTGIQNGYWIDKGGYTGETSFMMAENIGCKYALLGHSERRHQFKETNHEIRMKLENILNNTKLIPVLCVGETQQERNEDKTLEILEAQLRAAYDSLAWDKDRSLIIAYEPVWAIGTGNACEPLDAQIQHERIKKITNQLIPEVKPIILYGGSVNAENCFDYIKQEDINGVLVGGSSTKFESWLEIIKAGEKDV
jgi:triosephosphate isomerase